MTRVLDIDPFLGTVETFSYDASNDAMTITRSQDVTAILERNKALQNDNTHWRNQAHTSPEGIDMRLLASIPVVVEEKWLRDYGVRLDQLQDLDMRKKALSLLNSSDWKWLKCSDVRA